MAGEEKIAAEWLRRTAEGDREAFGRLYDHAASLVFSFAMRILQERAAAEDLLQEVFLQIWRDAGSYSPGRGSPEAWIITITRSRAIDRLRSKRRRDKSFVPMERAPGQEHDGAVESGAETSDARLTVSSALAELSESQRKAMELAYFDGLSQSEIAARTGEPLGTVKTRMRDGMKHLQTMLRDLL